MPKHCAALPGASNELLGSSGAELATALLERFGFIPEPRDGGPRRHAAAVPTLPPYAPKQRTRRTGLPSKPVMAAMSVTAIGAVAAVTATGQFAAVAPVRASLSLPDQAPATAAPIAAPIAAPPVASTLTSALQTVHVSSIVDDATSAAKTFAARAAAAKADAAKKAEAAKAAAVAHVPRPTPGTDAPKVSAGAGVGAAALAVAEGKIGTPYVWGASGPNAFDCSGLVMWAFKQVGVSLPRTAAAQSQVGTAVSKGDLQPGDLVFFYSPVSHVGIYLGDGKVLNATQSGEPVQISNMAYMPFHNARRV
ncbi:NlpC/P60 family protein [Pseudonocardia sp. 73-21]|uniref:C40 family peptidase n=1 Tax=Pseudonocardia sp. 73-21 TaxID=1895809 RepID=UPI0009678732|nr:NlpC/P60 family protein [Pseudonocardia sp. 73-21]OJY47146.1 MAG: hypothetical protein BGP03_11520 [Pseudonocardia sp. 73-21]